MLIIWQLLLQRATVDLLDVVGVEGTPENVAQRCFNHEVKQAFKHKRNQTPLNLLPRLVWLRVFQFLSAEYVVPSMQTLLTCWRSCLARAGQVCTTFLNLTREDTLWKTIVPQYGDNKLLNTIHLVHCFDSLTGAEFVKSVLVRDNNIRGYYYDRDLLLKCTAYIEPDELSPPPMSRVRELILPSLLTARIVWHITQVHVGYIQQDPQKRNDWCVSVNLCLIWT